MYPNSPAVNILRKKKGNLFLQSREIIDIIKQENIDAILLITGMQDTPEFAGELLEALRGRRKHDMKLTKRELFDYWHRLTNPCFDSKLRLFFDM